MHNCSICTVPDCDCLCDTCIRARIIFNLPDHVYEMSEYSREKYINKTVRECKRQLDCE